MAHSRRSKAQLATQTWQLMFDFLIFTSPSREHSLARRGLTPNDNRALYCLDEEHGRPIGTLATQWGCDPSNATFIIDRLEKSGLAERRTAESDRRVKLVALTPLGARMRAELLGEFYTPPLELLNLPVADLETLAKIIRKLQPAPKNTAARRDPASPPTTRAKRNP
jgi:DNA-binding MarR family transcriptional regulator